MKDSRDASRLSYALAKSDYNKKPPRGDQHSGLGGLFHALGNVLSMPKRAVEWEMKTEGRLNHAYKTQQTLAKAGLKKQSSDLAFKAEDAMKRKMPKT